MSTGRTFPRPPAPAPAPPADGAGARAGTARTARTRSGRARTGRDPDDAGRGKRQAIPARATSGPRWRRAGRPVRNGRAAASLDDTRFGPRRARRRPPPSLGQEAAEVPSKRLLFRERLHPARVPPTLLFGEPVQRVGGLASLHDPAKRSLAVVLDVIDPAKPTPVNAAIGHPPEERPARRPVLVEARQLQVPGAIHEQVAHVGVELAQLGVDLADEGGPLAIEPRKRGPEIVAHGGVRVQHEDPVRAAVVTEEPIQGGAVMEVRRRGVDPEPLDLPPQQLENLTAPVGRAVVPHVARAERARRQRPTDRRQNVQEIEVGVVVDDRRCRISRQQAAAASPGTTSPPGATHARRARPATGRPEAPDPRPRVGPRPPGPPRSSVS